MSGGGFGSQTRVYIVIAAVVIGLLSVLCFISAGPVVSPLLSVLLVILGVVLALICIFLLLLSRA